MPDMRFSPLRTAIYRCLHRLRPSLLRYTKWALNMLVMHIIPLVAHFLNLDNQRYVVEYQANVLVGQDLLSSFCVAPMLACLVCINRSR